MRIGLIDVDGHNFPNLVLMKLSAYHKAKGDTVEWYSEDASIYDIVYMSKVFSDDYTKSLPDPTNAKVVIKGGTGYAIWLEGDREIYHPELDQQLPAEIEHMYPDYSLYPEYTGWGRQLRAQTAYGFLTRGCPRGCSFCHVAAKEGRCSYKVADLSEFWHGQGHINLYDPNILACKDAPDLLRQLKESKARIEFNQGIDARLLTPVTAELLANMRTEEIHFAMDTMKDIEIVQRGLRLYSEAFKKTQTRQCRYRVFLLTNFDTTHEEDMIRVKAVRECGGHPYVMIYNKKTAPQITKRLQRWTNNGFIWGRFQDFEEYQRATYKKPPKERR